MYRILFVCLGNICRSPLAETILNSKLQPHNLSVEIDSAGLIAYHAGEMADARMRAHAIRRGYNITHRARKIELCDFSHFDLIVGMDDENMRELSELAPQGTQSKLVRATKFCQKFAHITAVPDPYYGGDAGFEYVIDVLEDACEGLVAQLITQSSDKK